MMITNNLRRFLPCLMALVLCLPVKGMPQVANELPDSILYSLAVYKKMYEEYTNKQRALQADIRSVVAEEFDVREDNIGMNTKVVDDLGADLLAILDLTEAIGQKLGVSVSEEQSAKLVTVGDIYHTIRPAGDSVILQMIYYPWRTVFDFRSVYRAGVYEDGIGILTDLIKLTTDSIQREIYLDELMDVYDVWYTYADTINKQIDSPFSKTLIRSEKARKYIDLMPKVYGVGLDSISSRNIMERYAMRAYEILQDVLFEQDGKEDAFHRLPDYYYSVSRAFLVYNTDKYKEQYLADYDSAMSRLDYMSDYLNDQLNSGSLSKGEVNFVSNTLRGMEEHKDFIMTKHQEVLLTFDIMSGDCDALEMKFEEELLEKYNDEKFLKNVIATMSKCPESYVYVQALEYYVALPPTSVEMLADIIKMRGLLAIAYLREERYADAAKQYAQVAKDEKDKMKKAKAAGLAAQMYIFAEDYRSAYLRSKDAIKYAPEPNYGDAYYYLGIAMSHLNWLKIKEEREKVMDLYKYLLVVEKYELALQKVREYGNDPVWKDYNREKEEKINKSIVSAKSHVPSPEEAHERGLPNEYKIEGSTLTIFGEKVKVRFYP